MPRTLILAAAMILAGVFAVFAPARALAQAGMEVRATAQVESDRVYVGQPFTLQVSVEGDTRSQPPEVPAIDGFRVEQAGSTTSSEIVFDGTRTVERARRIFQYSLTATRPGVLTVPSIEVRTRDGVRRTEPLRVTVVEPGELPDFKLRLDVDREEVCVGEPVTLRLTWFLGREVRTAMFSMPPLPEGFSLYSPADDGLTPAHFQSGQFFEVMFLGERSVARAGRGEIDGREFYTLTIEKTIVPDTPGSFALGPATVAFTEATRTRRSVFDSSLFSQSAARTEVVASAPLTLRVRPLPAQGRPATFSGLVGAYTIEARAEPTRVRVGDPITLTVTVKGDGPAERIPMLDLSKQPGFANDFKLTGERPTSEFVPGGRRFTTMIRAREPDVSAIPPIELTYFDPRAGEYRTAASAPIPLRVEAAPKVELPASLASVDAPEEDDRGAQQASRGPREVSIDDLAPASGGMLALARGPLGVAALAAPPVVALAIVAAAAARGRSARDAKTKRRAGALRRALRDLDRAHDADGVLLALRGFAADWTGRSRDAMTAEEAVAVAEREGGSASRAVREAVEACAAALFGGGGSIDLDALRRKVREALPQVDAALRTEKAR